MSEEQSDTGGSSTQKPEPEWSVGLTEEAIADRRSLSTIARDSLRHAFEKLEHDPRALPPYRHEFAPFPLGFPDAHFVRWAYGRVVISYVYLEEYRIVMVLGLSELHFM